MELQVVFENGKIMLIPQDDSYNGAEENVLFETSPGYRIGRRPAMVRASLIWADRLKAVSNINGLRRDMNGVDLSALLREAREEIDE